VNTGQFEWSAAQIGALVAVPVLTGSILRLPMGILTDMFGGRIVYGLLMLVSAIPMYWVSRAETYMDFWWAGLGFGLTGASFAVGIAYTSIWFKKGKQGTALGIFGVGNTGAAMTTLFAPILLSVLSDWRMLPKIYSLSLVVMAILFFVFTHSKKVGLKERKTLKQRLLPLKNIRVWRFGLYYFFVFGSFVALTGWLPIYYINVYELNLITVGILATVFVLPSGLIRAVGGWMSDHWGARKIMYWILSIGFLGCLLLTIPNAELISKGEGVRSQVGSPESKATVAQVADDFIQLQYKTRDGSIEKIKQSLVTKTQNQKRWQQSKVEVGEEVVLGELIARGYTKYSLGFSCTIFTIIVFVVGISMGIGMAAVYRHIPDYFPDEVGVVGGIVGVIGGLGGYFCPKIFGLLLDWTGIWTTCWMFLSLVAIICLVWMHIVVRRMLISKSPRLMSALEE